MRNLPVLLRNDLTPAGPLHPLTCQRTRQLKPLSTLRLTLERGLLSPRDLVALDGEVYRVSNLSIDAGGVCEATLQHGLCTLSDHMHPGEASKSGSLKTLLTELLSNQTRWVLGDCEVPDDKELAWEVNNSNDLQSLLDIMNELPAYRIETDQTTLPWVLHIRALSTEVGSEARMERNLSKAKIDYDATSMCTVAYADGIDAPIQADTSATWGEIVRHVSVDEDLGEDLIREAVDRYLEQSKDPKVTITLTAVELARLTGDPIDRFRLGDLCRCVLPEINLTTVQRIVTIDQPDMIDEPDYMLITLASTQSELSISVAGLVVDVRHVNQLYQQLEKDLRIEAETIDMLAEEITLLATKAEVDGISTRIAQAEISLNDILGELALRVTYTDLESELNEVSLTLDAMNSSIAAKADLILLDGYVKMEDFEAVEGWATDFAGVTISGSSIVGGYGDFDDLWCGQLNGGTAATQEWVTTELSQYVLKTSLSKQSLTVVTGIDVVTSLEGRVTAVQPVTTQFWYYT